MASSRPRRNKDGKIISYEIRVSRGYDPITRKALKPFTTTYTPPERWSDKAIARGLSCAMGEFQAACDRGEVLTKEEETARELERIEQAKQSEAEEERKPTFEKYVEVYLSEKQPVFAPGTYVYRKSVLTKAVVGFGLMKMEDITPLQIRGYLIDLQTNTKTKREGKPLAHTTVIAHYAALRSLFETAVENEVIPANPMRNVKPPKPRKNEAAERAIAYSERDVRYILECLNKEALKWKAFVMFAIDSGCRRGEIVGLRWEEIDFKTGKANICRNAQYASGMGVYISTPKTGKSRAIYLNPPVLAILKEWKREQSMLILAQGVQSTGYCFTQDNGEMMHPHSPTLYLSKFGKKYNLPGIHPHALRHTMATISIANGADIVSISKKLGHAQPSMTLNVYSHANEEAQRRANDTLAEALYVNTEK